nr:hypothetical protein Itr_chr08CG13690 [Ipomoea trifida]
MSSPSTKLATITGTHHRCRRNPPLLLLDVCWPELSIVAAILIAVVRLCCLTANVAHRRWGGGGKPLLGPVKLAAE